MVECRWESNSRPVAHTVSTRTRPHSVTPRESVGTEARALQRSPTGKQTLPHSAALSRNLPHFATLCRTLLHSAALCCYLPPSVILGHSRAQSAVLMNTLQCRTKAPSDCTDSATLSHIECQVGRAHLGVGVRGRVWPSVAVPRLALFTLCYSQARSAALGYTLSGYAAICPPRQLGRVQLS